MSKFSVKKPYTVLVAVIMVIVLGVVSGFRAVYILIRRFIGDDDGKSQGS